MKRDFNTENKGCSIPEVNLYIQKIVWLSDIIVRIYDSQASLFIEFTNNIIVAEW